jgi:hypothetical protein
LLFLLALPLGVRVKTKWLDALKEEEYIHHTAAALRVRDLSIQTPKEPTSKNSKNKDTDRLGLIAKWSRHFGYISIHDPTTGEWHDLKTEDAPDWAKREAFKRKELYRDGNRKAFSLTAPEMEEIWEAERVAEPEGIVEDHPIEEERE